MSQNKKRKKTKSKPRPHPKQRAGQASKTAALFVKAVKAHKSGQTQQAVTIYENILRIDPNHIDTLNNLGIAFRSLNRPDDAAGCFQNLLKIDARHYKAHYDFANLLLEQGKLNQALSHYQNAVSLVPDYVDAWLNMGIVHKYQGNLEKALECFKQVTRLKPGDASALNNSGLIFSAVGQVDQAISCYQTSIRYNPNIAETHYNLCNLLKSKGCFKEAMASLKKALDILPDQMMFWQVFATTMARLDPADLDPSYVPLCLHGLLLKDVEKSGLVKPCIHFLSQDTPLKNILDMAALGKIQQIEDHIRFRPDLPGLGQPLFLRLLENAVLTSPSFEVLLVMLRNVFLDLILNSDIEFTEKALEFVCALARQCFLNEYVYYQSEPESDQVDKLKKTVESQIGSELPVFKIAILAAYMPLYLLGNAQILTAQSNSSGLPAFTDLIQQQIKEPLEEIQIRKSIRQLTPIEKAVSRKVQMQYEENPYPRWTSVTYKIPSMLIKRLGEVYPHAVLGSKLNVASPKILIAGCGTGKHAIEVARSTCGAKVLALDLSSVSLSYAIRKARELEVSNIEFIQGDILELDRIDDAFDVIESVGVLHHMEDPLAGWQILTQLLKPGGYMKVGLYSAIAREYIAQVRSELTGRFENTTLSDIREFRNNMIHLANGPARDLFTSARDFYSASECRDMFFHVQEHRLTLPEIRGILSKLGLVFLGFEFGDRANIYKYQAMFPEDPHCTSIENWHRFEQKHPLTFIGMYQIGLLKK